MIPKIKELATLLMEIANGKQAQYRSTRGDGIWRGIPTHESSGFYIHNFSGDSGFEIRIKPDPTKMRLIRGDELPSTFWVLKKGVMLGDSFETWNLCLGISSDGFLWTAGNGSNKVHLATLAKEECLWSANRGIGSTPQSFLVEDKS